MLWSLLGSGGTYAVALLAGVASAQLLGKDGYGDLSMVTSTLQTLSVFAGVGLGTTGTRYVAAWRRDEPARAGRALALVLLSSVLLGLALAAAIVPLAASVASAALEKPGLAASLAAGAPLLLSTALAGTQAGALAGLEAFRALSRLTVLRTALTAIGTVGGILAGGLTGGIVGAGLAGLAGCAAGHVVLAASCREAGVPLAAKGALAEASILGRFALPTLLAAVVVTPAQWVAQAAAFRQPGGEGELAVLGATGQWRTALLVLPTVLQQVALPLLSSGGEGKDDRGGWDDVVELSQAAVLVVVYPVCAALLLLVRPILSLYGEAFPAGEAIAVAAVASVLLQSAGNANAPVLQARERTWLGLVFNATFAAVLLAVALGTVERWGGLSVALGLAAGHALLNGWGLLWLRKDLPRGFVGRAFAAMALAVGLSALALGTPAALRPWLALPVSLATLVVCYVGLAPAAARARLVGLPRAVLARLGRKR